MPHDSKRVSETIPKEALGSLGGCLVEGDPEQRRRERGVRHRSLIISILTQVAVVALLILLPLFSKSQPITLAVATPIPPYGHAPHHAAAVTTHGTGRSSISPNTLRFFTPTAPPMNPTNPGENTVGPPNIGGDGIEGESGPACSWCIDIGGRNNGPQPPPANPETRVRPRTIYETRLDPAMLTYRVDPVYPILPKQLHKEGRVELHAIIAIDGSIQSLEVLSGDPMFYRSALEAVQQWHYKPTILNGQPVQIDTRITVIYTMPH